MKLGSTGSRSRRYGDSDGKKVTRSCTGALKATIGIRVDDEEEFYGGDIMECGLEAYPEFTAT